MNDFFQRLAEERPRTYGALLLTLGLAVLAFMRGYAEVTGRASLVLVLLAPFPIVFGVQALALGTTPSALRSDRVTAIVLFAASGVGSVLLWTWMAS